VNFGLAPGAEIHRIQGDAKQVGRNEAELRGTKADEANDYTVDCRKNPALPTSPSYQNCGNDCKYARQVIKPEHSELLVTQTSMPQKRPIVL
jgi:hypothetical protein